MFSILASMDYLYPKHKFQCHILLHQTVLLSSRSDPYIIKTRPYFTQTSPYGPNSHNFYRHIESVVISDVWIVQVMISVLNHHSIQSLNLPFLLLIVFFIGNAQIFCHSVNTCTNQHSFVFQVMNPCRCATCFLQCFKLLWIKAASKCKVPQALKKQFII